MNVQERREPSEPHVEFYGKRERKRIAIELAKSKYAGRSRQWPLPSASVSAGFRGNGLIDIDVDLRTVGVLIEIGDDVRNQPLHLRISDRRTFERASIRRAFIASMRDEMIGDQPNDPPRLFSEFAFHAIVPR